MKFTVFTPTFNRKELLEKLYKSLQKQTFKDFEWLIVDDGSTDGTKEKVEEFLSEKKLEIKYYFKENGGKQRAYNFATEKANGELFICLDSDDEYVENGLETILKYWKKYEKNSDIAGMGYLSTYPNGEIIGSSFPEKEMISTQFEIYNKYGVKGDTTQLLFNRAIGQRTIRVPLNVASERDTLLLRFSSSTETATDTLIVSHQPKSHFESLDCPASVFHTLTKVNWHAHQNTSNLLTVQEVLITNPNVAYENVEHLKVFLRPVAQ